MKTGIIGLGAMGAPMARNLHTAGHLATFWNRTPETAAALAGELGIAPAADPQALAGQCALIILSVSADTDVLEVIDLLTPGLQPEILLAMQLALIFVELARQVAPPSAVTKQGPPAT